MGIVIVPMIKEGKTWFAGVTIGDHASEGVEKTQSRPLKNDLSQKFSLDSRRIFFS
jgi:hypothetical protein